MRRLFRRIPRPTLTALLLIPILLLIDTLCYQVALPVTITFQQGKGTLSVGNTRLSLGKMASAFALQFPAYNPLVHEYQIDGTDSTNNLDLDTNYLSQISNSFYYRLQAWMRDLDGTSRWRNLVVQGNGRVQKRVAWPANGGEISLPNATTLQISLQLQRPETSRSLYLLLNDGNILQLTLDRNNRKLTVTSMDTNQVIASTFFPTDVAPFAAMVVDTLARILLWALGILLAIQLIETALGLAQAWWSNRHWRTSNSSETDGDDDSEQLDQSATDSLPDTPRPEEQNPPPSTPDVDDVEKSPHNAPDLAEKTVRQGGKQTSLTHALHPLALIGLGCSLVFVIWIAVVGYQGQPHIYDASAYLFAAKMYATGHLFVPAPPLSKLFPGPFMLIANGKWFAQYDPGTALTLVPGIWLGVPWVVEPVLGTLALLGIGLITARLYNRRVATLTVLLGCLSPFYSYLAASYLSHAIALFYLVWGLWALLRFIQGGGGWSLPVSAFCFGMAALTRDLVALLYIAILLPGTIIVAWERRKYKRSRLGTTTWLLAFVAVVVAFTELYMSFNLLLTGDPFITPRVLFFPGDVWGFGQGIGFYGQHTLAAGLVNLDELLTSLQIDLFGWPFYLTLAFIAFPFLLGCARKADWFLLIALILTVGSYIGYFYHGIYLGPRYLFEDLPFLLILSARGILTLGAWGMERGHATLNWLKKRVGNNTWSRKPVTSSITIALVSALILCNLVYYLPRQFSRFQNYTSLPNLYQLDTSQIYHTQLHHAIVITNNQLIYQQVLFALNDPYLKGDVIYALVGTSSQIAQLRKQFPSRAIYLLFINADGSVSYILMH